jgi:hypothetical protein
VLITFGMTLGYSNWKEGKIFVLNTHKEK